MPTLELRSLKSSVLIIGKINTAIGGDIVLNKKEGLQALENSSYDVVVVDLKILQDSTIQEAYQKLKVRNPSAQILVFGANLDFESVVQINNKVHLFGFVKDFADEHILNALEKVQLEKQNTDLKSITQSQNEKTKRIVSRLGIAC